MDAMLVFEFMEIILIRSDVIPDSCPAEL